MFIIEIRKMKKIWLLVLSLLFVPFCSFAMCEWTWECKDTIDPNNPTDEDIQFLLDLWFINATKEEVEKFWLEQIKAYYWASNLNITTMKSVKKANLDWRLTRFAMAKMISNYSINALWKEPDTSKKCVFTDITNDLDKEYDYWVTKACQLGLMGQWIIKFRPYDPVTRAEFWTVLSRALYWEKYNWWTPYYQKHLNHLNAVWIMKNIEDSEDREEIRWYVLLMMMRGFLSNNKIHQNTSNNISKEIHINQLKDDFYVKKLWSLDDHWIADTVWFHDFYWSYFDIENWLPSMFSCEDISTNTLKENVKNNCSRYEVWNDKYSFVVFWEPKIKIKGWKITLKDTYTISEYSLWNASFEDAIKNSEERLDSEIYCLKKQYYWNYFSHDNKYWIAWLGKNLNTYSNNWDLVIYYIHKKLWDWTCWNNKPWMVFHINNSDYFNVVISSKDNEEFPTYDGYYSTPFSIDVSNI